MPEGLTQFWSLLQAVVLLCPPLTGLIVLAVVACAIPARWQLAYWALGLSVLTSVCWRIVRANPDPGPDPRVLTSGLFAQFGVLLSVALVAVLLYRWLRTGSPLSSETSSQPV